MSACGCPVPAGKARGQDCWGGSSRRDGPGGSCGCRFPCMRWVQEGDGHVWSLLQGSVQEEPEHCLLSPPSLAFWGQDPYGAFPAAQWPACMRAVSVCFWGDDGEQPYEPTWVSYPTRWILDSVPVPGGLPRDGVLEQQEGFPLLRAAFPWLWSSAACSKPWPALLPCVPKHGVTL